MLFITQKSLIILLCQFCFNLLYNYQEITEGILLNQTRVIELLIFKFRQLKLVKQLDLICFCFEFSWGEIWLTVKQEVDLIKYVSKYSQNLIPIRDYIFNYLLTTLRRK